MTRVLEIIDKAGKKIYLTNERYKHILKHPHMHNILEEIRETLETPLRVDDYTFEEGVKFYYRYYKEKKLKAKFLRVIVKYLNGEGFIVTAHFVEKIR